LDVGGLIAVGVATQGDHRVSSDEDIARYWNIELRRPAYNSVLDMVSKKRKTCVAMQVTPQGGGGGKSGTHALVIGTEVISFKLNVASPKLLVENQTSNIIEEVQLSVLIWPTKPTRAP
jgi:hypothetical protein